MPQIKPRACNPPRDNLGGGGGQSVREKRDTGQISNELKCGSYFVDWNRADCFSHSRCSPTLALPTPSCIITLSHSRHKKTKYVRVHPLILLKNRDTEHVELGNPVGNFCLSSCFPLSLGSGQQAHQRCGGVMVSALPCKH